jgi:hypothetical protein
VRCHSHYWSNVEGTEVPSDSSLPRIRATSLRSYSLSSGWLYDNSCSLVVQGGILVESLLFIRSTSRRIRSLLYRNKVTPDGKRMLAAIPIRILLLLPWSPMFIYWDGFIKIQQGRIQRTSHSSISYFLLRPIVTSSRSSCCKYSQFLCFLASVSISWSNAILLIHTLWFPRTVPNLFLVVMPAISVFTRGCTQSFLPFC